MTKFLTAYCWIVICLVLALLWLTGCAPTDSASLQAQAELAAQRERRQTADARQAKIEREAADEAATMEAREQDQHEIDMLLSGAQATVSAIQAEQDRLDLALAGRQATQAAWGDSLRVTQTMADVQATQTVQPTAIAAAMQIAAARASRAQVVSNAAPFVMLIAILALLAAAGIAIRWLWLLVEWGDRKNGQVHTPYGLMQYRHDGELTDRAKISIPRLSDDPIPAAPVLEYQEDEPEREPGLRDQALELLDKAVDIYGTETHVIPGWRRAGWSSDKWQRVVDYLRTVGLAQTSPGGTKAIPSVRDVVYKLETTDPREARE